MSGHVVAAHEPIKEFAQRVTRRHVGDVQQAARVQGPEQPLHYVDGILEVMQRRQAGCMIEPMEAPEFLDLQDIGRVAESCLTSSEVIVTKEPRCLPSSPACRKIQRRFATG